MGKSSASEVYLLHIKNNETTKEADFQTVITKLRALNQLWETEIGPYGQKDFVKNFVRNDENSIKIQKEGHLQAVVMNRLQSAIAKGHQPAKIYSAGMLIGLNRFDDAYKLILARTVLKDKKECDHNANYLLALSILQAYGHPVVPEESDFKPILRNVLRNDSFLVYIRQKYDFVDKSKIVAQLLQACGPDYQEKIIPQTRMSQIFATVKPHNEMYPRLNEPFNILRVIYHIAYGNIVDSDTLTQKIKEGVSSLKEIRLTEDDWNAIYYGLTHGHGRAFLKKLKECGMYSKLFGSTFNQSPEQEEKNDAWLEKRFDEMDAKFRKDSNYPYSFQAAVYLVAKELTSTSTAEDERLVHQKYQITYPFDYTFKLQIQGCRDIIPSYKPIEGQSIAGIPMAACRLRIKGG